MSSLSLSLYVCIDIYTYIDTYIDTYTHTYIHKYIHACILCAFACFFKQHFQILKLPICWAVISRLQNLLIAVCKCHGLFWDTHTGTCAHLRNGKLFALLHWIATSRKQLDRNTLGVSATLVEPLSRSSFFLNSTITPLPFGCSGSDPGRC